MEVKDYCIFLRTPTSGTLPSYNHWDLNFVRVRRKHPYTHFQWKIFVLTGIGNGTKDTVKLVLESGPSDLPTPNRTRRYP